ncbi:MAG: LysM peptidoglycan-binding domain-containing protein [Proteobacteria bacterium]|nr:LysM peptidoglycan-binding domain-containing protein [Pseudomonadota bacterium]
MSKERSRAKRRNLVVAVIVFAMLFVTLVPASVFAAPSDGQSASGQESGYYGVHYKVKRGDTLARIARRYGTTVAAISRANGIHNPNRIYVGQWLYIPKGKAHYGKAYYGKACANPYRVKRGDTLSRIARRYGVSVYALKKANGIYNVNRIYVGQKLCIPKKHGYYPPAKPGYGYKYHVVKRGQTLSGVARRYGTSVRCLMHANGIGNPNWIYAGQKLNISSCY